MLNLLIKRTLKFLYKTNPKTACLADRKRGRGQIWDEKKKGGGEE